MEICHRKEKDWVPWTKSRLLKGALPESSTFEESPKLLKLS